jgi:anaerobic dimethyl sulfoxide reductase subunit A
VAHKKGDVIVRLSTDNGTYQEGGSYGKDTELEPQLRACLRGRSYRSRIYSPERLLYPMIRVGERGEGKFRRASWDEALNTGGQQDGAAQTYVWADSHPGPVLRRCFVRCVAQV